MMFSSSSEEVHYLFYMFYTRVPVFNYKLCLNSAYFSSDSDQITFSIVKAMLWIEDSYFSQNQHFEVKNILIANKHCLLQCFFFLLHNMLIDGLE